MAWNTVCSWSSGIPCSRSCWRRNISRLQTFKIGLASTWLTKLKLDDHWRSDPTSELWCTGFECFYASCSPWVFCSEIEYRATSDGVMITQRSGARRSTMHMQWGPGSLADEVHRSWSALQSVDILSLIHIWRCRRSYACRSRWSPYH